MLACGIASRGGPKPKASERLEDNILGTVDDELKNQDHQGVFSFVIVGPDDKPIETQRYVRGIPGQLAVREFPHVWVLEGQSLFTAGTQLDAKVPVAGGVQVFCKADPAASDGIQYHVRCTANLPPAKYTLDPFGIDFQVTDVFTPQHPAVTAERKTLTIHTAAVTFRAVDARSGLAAPLSGLELFAGKVNLLDHLADMGKAAPVYSTVTLYLPRGVEYQSNLGRFKIDDHGQIQSGLLAAGVQFDAATNAFVQQTTGGQPVASVPTGKGYWLLSHNLRRVFRRGEVARFDVILSGNYPAAELTVSVKPQPPATMPAAFAAGKLSLPSVTEGTDSRLALLDTSALAPGKYQVSLDHPDADPFGFEIVELLPTSPLLLFTANACGESDFKIDPSGMDELQKTGVTCFTNYGFGSVLGRFDPSGHWAAPYGAPPADAPAELRRTVTPPRLILDDALRHGLITYDYENRRDSWYMEGLAFHHTHPLTVDRMVRRVQIFSQELEDFPSLAGMTYTWFPMLGGYVEGGVCTDPFFATRMDLLRQKVKEQTGFEPTTSEEGQQFQKLTQPREGFEPLAPPDLAKLKTLTDKFRNYWRAEQRLGWFDTFAHYNQKLREVRPDFVATTSENAGHDSGKSLPDMGGAHDAMSFESYTDFGDWPMSAGFVADWAHGQIPGKPVWQSVDPSQSEPSIVTKQFYKFARGVEGIANGVHGPENAHSNAKRAMTNAFLQRYGSLITDWSPDTQVAICVSEMQFGEYDAHALHCALTRLGYGPIILSERTLEKTGVPPAISAVFVPNLRVPFSEAADKQFADFAKRGGKIVQVGASTIAIPSAARVDVQLKTLWDVGGFNAHLPFFAEFRKMRPALEKAIAEAGLRPRNGAAPEKAVILPSMSAGIRYVTVVSSPLDARDTECNAVTDVKVETDADTVVNLVTGASLPVKDGAVSIDLVSEPVAFLALLKAAPQSITLHCPADASTGNTLALSADVAMGGPTARPPVEYVITDAAGAVRARFYRLAADKQGASYSVAANDASGDWTITASELLTGLTAKATVKVRSAAAAPAIVAAPEVYLPHPDRLKLFMARTQPVRVLVEETQTDAMADAERIVAAIKQSGRDAAVQQVTPSSYDMYWLKWVETPVEQATLARIDAGDVVGYRGNLTPYISTAKRAQVPEKGGWSEIDPPYVIRTDTILFSSGRICQSLSAVTEWTATANVPGKGRGALEVSLSPFWADRDAVAVVFNDEVGRRKATDRLLELIASKGSAGSVPTFATARIAPASATVTGATRTRIVTPLKGFIPPALVEDLVTSSDGFALVQTKHATTVVTPQGATRAVPRFEISPCISRGGSAFGGMTTVTATFPGWGFPTAWDVNVHSVDAAGALQSFPVPQTYSPGDRFDGWDKPLAVAPGGETLFAARDGGAFFLFDLHARSVRAIDEPSHDVHFYEQVRVPVSITSSRFSPDGRFVAFTVGNHPSGYGGMMGPPTDAFATMLRVVDAHTGKTVWTATSRKMSDSSFAAVGDCLAISKGGRRVALIDWDQEAALFDETGKEIYRKPIFDWKLRHDRRSNPKPMRCELSTDGETALFASDGDVVITDGNGATLTTVRLPAMVDARLMPDGSMFFVADQDGLVQCVDRKGMKQWALQSTGEKPRLGATDKHLLIAEGAGNLLTVETATGKVSHTTNVVGAKPATGEFQSVKFEAPPTYREPQTLAVLQAQAAATLVKRWEPAGDATTAYGRSFYRVHANVTLSVEALGSGIIHLAYRYVGKQVTKVSLKGGDQPRVFELDLATPEYRVVDLPYESAHGISVEVAAAEGLEISELSAYRFTMPGSNSLFVRPAGSNSDREGLETPPQATKKLRHSEDPDAILDDKDPSAVAKAVAGRMKNAAIFSNNADPDQIEGHYIRATGNPLENFDGRKFTEGGPSAWTRSQAGPFGSRLLVDLNHRARPKLCVTYERTLKQSEVMRGIAILQGRKTDFALGENPGPDRLTHEPRVIAAVTNSDQFFNVFDMLGVDIDALGVYVVAREGKDLGLSEVELYE